MIFGKDLTHTAPRLLQCALSDPILYLFTAAVDRHGKKTVLLYIFAKTIEKKEQGLETSVTGGNF